MTLPASVVQCACSQYAAGYIASLDQAPKRFDSGAEGDFYTEGYEDAKLSRRNLPNEKHAAVRESDEERTKLLKALRELLSAYQPDPAARPEQQKSGFYNAIMVGSVPMIERAAAAPQVDAFIAILAERGLKVVPLAERGLKVEPLAERGLEVEPE